MVKRKRERTPMEMVENMYAKDMADYMKSPYNKPGNYGKRPKSWGPL